LRDFLLKRQHEYNLRIGCADYVFRNSEQGGITMQAKVESSEVKRWIDNLRAEIAEEPKPSAIRTRGGVLSTQRSEPEILRCLTPTMRALCNETINLRLEVVKSFAAEPDDMNLELLSRLAKVEPDWQVRKEVAETAANIPVPKAVEILADLAKMDSDEDVRICAVQCLGKLAAPSTRVPEAMRERSKVRTRGGAGLVQDEIRDVLDDVRATDWSQKVKDSAHEPLDR
jgi:hypothetical protein